MSRERTSTSLYAVLGVKPDATSEQIRLAYRELARQHHPDVSDAPGTAERFAAIAEAYQILSDTRRRRSYDAALRSGGIDPTVADSLDRRSHQAHYTWTNIANGSTAEPDGPSEFDELYNAFFGGGGDDKSP